MGATGLLDEISGKVAQGGGDHVEPTWGAPVITPRKSHLGPLGTDRDILPQEKRTEEQKGGPVVLSFRLEKR